MSGPFKEHGLKLVENGYAIIPIPKGTKGPRFEGWQDVRVTTAEQYAEFVVGKRRVEKQDGRKGDFVMVPNVRETDGIGILTKFNPAIDIDCYDETIVAKMIEFCTKLIGAAPVRIGNAPKALLMYIAGKPFNKITSARYYDPANADRDPKRNGQRIEILGDGQQFVAYHTHPDTGKPYVWPDEWMNPLDVPCLDLPTLYPEQALEVCRAFERLCKEAGWEKIGEGSVSLGGTTDPDDALAELPPPPETEEEVERVRSALEAMKPHSSEYDYDEWRNVLFALKWTRWDCAEALAREWSETSDKHVTKEFNTVWRGAQKRNRGREMTLGTLFSMAKKVGWDASRAVSEEEIAANVETIKNKIAAIEFENNTSKAVQQIIKDMAKLPLTSSDEGDLLKLLKKETGYGVVDMRRDLTKARKEHNKQERFIETHAGYASNIISQLEDNSGVRPVGVEGNIYVYSERKGVWQGTMSSDFAVEISRQFDGRPNCERRSDYTAIAAHAYSILSMGNEQFFENAPIGLACEGRFYKVNDNGEIEREEIEHNHRQRVLSPVRPNVMETPLWNNFLDQTFESIHEGEKQQQIDLLQEVMGSIMLGTLAKYEKAVLFKGPGRAGKGTVMKIIEKLLPTEVRSAVSPFKWDSEYYLANLAGKRLNVVGELPDDEPIPAAQFKTVTGRDTLTGRHPSHRPFTFRNQAAHVFNTNHYIYTKDHTEAFYSRWILLEFRNSRIGRESEQQTDLAEQIIEKELPGIMAWGLQGAKRLEQRGYFLTTKTHHRMMSEWRHRVSTLIEFLLDGEVCKLGEVRVRRADLYRAYVEWCKESNRRPMGKMKLYDELDSYGCSQLGVRKGTDEKMGDVVIGVALIRDSIWEHPPDEDEL